jgi:hypothetical protein
MNADITCTHYALALTKGFTAKKKLIDGKAWYFLRKFYPNGPQFKSTLVIDCSVCALGVDMAKALVCEKRESGLKVRRLGFLPPPLEALAARRYN